MERYRKILVAFDGSESSRNAFRQAGKLMAHDRSWVSVLVAVPPYTDQFQSLQAREKIQTALREEGRRIMGEAEALARSEGFNPEMLTCEDNPVDAILDTAMERHYGLVVMGRRGKSRLDRTMMGGVTARVIGTCPCDVLVVPRDGELSWQKLLVATDGSRWSAAAADKAISLAHSYNSSMDVLGVADINEEFIAEAPEAAEEMSKVAWKHVNSVKEQASAAGVDCRCHVREGDAHAVITKAASDLGSTMIVMGSRGRTGISRLLMGSVTEKVIGHTGLPVLVVKV